MDAVAEADEAAAGHFPAILIRKHAYPILRHVPRLHIKDFHVLNQSLGPAQAFINRP